MLENLQIDTFRGKENTEFEAPAPEGYEAVNFTLVKCKELPAHPDPDGNAPARTPFSLTFKVPARISFRQETVVLKHPLFGEEPVGIFMTIAGQSDDGQSNLYLATFN